VIQGEVRLERTLYVDDVKADILALLQDALRRQRLEIEETDDFLSSTALAIRIHGDPSQKALRVRNNVADLRGDIDLTLGGTLARPTVRGEIEIEPGGTLTLLDNEYKVERFNLLFNNAPRINPVIDLVARTEVQTFGITVTIDGTLEKPTTNFSSDSELAQLDILSMVLTGKEFDSSLTQGPSSGDAQPLAAQDLASSILAGQAYKQVSKRVGTLFSLDRFSISPIAEAGQTFSGVSVTAGKQVSRHFFLTYTSNGVNDIGQVLQVEYQAGRGLTVVLTLTDQDKYALDLKWERRF
jgi:autotransporter translocation and assembly factor TamB